MDTSVLANSSALPSIRELKKKGLTPLGDLIFLDRYARKDQDRSHLQVGQRVVVCVNMQTRQRELARIEKIEEGEGVLVRLENDDRLVSVPLDQTDQPIEVIEQALDRMAKAVAQAEKPEVREKWTKEFRSLMDGFGFVPAGRIWAGAGVEEKLTPYNCYVLPTPKDSRGGIIQTLDRMTEIMSRGGGVGIPLMSLRPRYGLVRGVNGRSSGSVAWGEIYSFGTGLIEQGGSRRGALMLIQYVWHPDILEFITAKKDNSRIKNANVSVGITDDFMKAVDEDANWDLVFPDTNHAAYNQEWDGDLSLWKEKGFPIKVYKTVRAREIWDLIVMSAWESAEPGLFFVDRYNQMSNSNYYSEGRIWCTNPSMPAGTLVHTSLGIMPIDQLEGQSFLVKSLDGTWADAKCFKSSDNAKLLEIDFGGERTTRSTPEHRWPVVDGEGNVTKVYARDLKPGDYIPANRNERLGHTVDGSLTYADGLVAGIAFGDGSYNIRQDTGKPWLHFHLNREDVDLQEVVADYFGASICEQADEAVINVPLALVQPFLDKVGLSLGDKRTLPSKLWRSNDEFVTGFVDGLFSSDGCVKLGDRRMVYTNKDADLVREVAVLLSFHGVLGSIQQSTTALNGQEFPRADLVVGRNAAQRFANVFRLSCGRKQEKLDELCNMEGRANRRAISTRVEAVREVASAPVWDISVFHEQHVFPTAWNYTGNCGEQGIPGWAVCNLGHLNLPQYLVGDGMFEPAKVDWDKLKKAVRTAVRFMDDVVDIAFAPFAENDKQQKSERRVGLGTMGLGEMLIRCHVRYGHNEKCDQFLDQLYGTICREAYLASADIAAEKGSFVYFDAEKLLASSGFAKTLPDDVKHAIRTKGLRGVTQLTQAPTGTVGTMMGTSTGIEPFTWWEWERKGRLGAHRERASVYEEYVQAHPDVAAKRAALPQAEQFTTSKYLPEWFVTCMEMTPEDHAHTQGAIQRWVDSSISKTSNLPSDYSPEQVGAYYRLLFELGCKGGTVYRDKSRDEQVLNVPTTTTVEPEPRGEMRSVPHDVYDAICVSVQTPAGKLSAKLGIHPDDGEAFEAWLDVSRAGTAMSADREAMARLVSLVLRMDSPLLPSRRLQLVIDQLDGIGGGDSAGFGPHRVLSVPDGIAKAFKMLLQRLRARQAPEAEEEETPKYVIGVEEVPKVVTKGANGHSKSNGNGANGHASGNGSNGRSRTPTAGFDLCPQCHQVGLYRTEGCAKCRHCDFSKC